ncbi:methyltransferase [Terricaulis silvestris]|uniref:Release factor glutamine methyltransferase n=1 Tax=Terricaulis silvestris TaxID=2686094 RepID=A0A6I6MJU8_9CAUL|nr:class I SAM-dependent methyltransferase [Terricaulis silvestris]QGZ94181.1 Release factor glutamine methyltransferase [Terricaulis silvestris]
MSEKIAALKGLLLTLKQREYRFITPTPATHARVIAREGKQQAKDLRDVFGWSLPFAPGVVDDTLLSFLRGADMLEERGGEMLRSLVRVSSLEDNFFLHSAFPTTRSDSVFFGPDSYRYANFLMDTLPNLPARTHVVDIGAGSGIGALTAVRSLPPLKVTLTDINPLALELARANWEAAGFEDAAFVECDALSGVTEPIDLIIANPPYIADPARRAYRDGGGMHGGAMSVRWAQEAARRLESGGVFALYTGSAMVGGDDPLRNALLEALADFDVLYGEIDPDVFGEELEREDYADVERIAVVGVVAVKR